MKKNSVKFEEMVVELDEKESEWFSGTGRNPLEFWIEQEA